MAVLILPEVVPPSRRHTVLNGETGEETVDPLRSG